MKIFLLFTIILGLFFVPSFAQNPESLELVALFEYRDSNDNLVAFFVDPSPGIVDKDKFIAYLETAPEQLVSTYDDSKIISVSGTILFSDYTTSSKTLFADHQNGIVYAFADHDGIPVTKGDTLTTTWIVTVPLN